MSVEAREKCGVVGVYNVHHDAARVAYNALFALQHRGQEGSGIGSTDGEAMFFHKGSGLVSHVYNEEIMTRLVGSCAIGHNRYGTSGMRGGHHLQPVDREDGLVAVAHNGNLPDTSVLEAFLREKEVQQPGGNDSEMMTDAIRYFLGRGTTLEEAIKEAFPLFTGAFSLVVMTKDKVAAVRDSKGIRPLCVGSLNGGFMFASESCALATVQARYIRDVLPGEMLVADVRGLTSHRIVEGDQKLDIFEFVYFARPDSLMLGKRVSEVRRNFGRSLAEEFPIAGDIVVPVPDSAIQAAEGYAEVLGVPVRQALAKNRYIHRTFIQPDQRLREGDVAMKLIPIPEIVAGKRIILVDDSIVRATTMRRIVEILRTAGAIEVHVLISSPPIRFPDFYGIDTPSQNDLIAARMSVDRIREFINANTLHYLPYDRLIQATGLPESVFSTSCFTGIYPIDIGPRKDEVVFELTPKNTMYD